MMIWRNWLAKSKSVSKDADGLADYPLREYVASMASELAQLARQDGDDRLAKALDGAAQIARDEKREPA